MKKKYIVLISVLSFIIILCLSLFIAWRVSYNKYKETGLPRLDISVDGKISSRDEYVRCEISLSGTEHELSGVSAGVRGRGNTTWEYPKKPYRIKFDEKTSLFGNEEGKSWVLLAMYNDFSYSKDALAFYLGASLENGDFVPSFNYVDLYINGKYNGLYLVTEQVNEKSGRLDIESAIDEGEVEIPFLVELDDYAEEDGGVLGRDYFKIDGLSFSIKYPEADEGLTEEQFNYVKEYIEAVHRLAYKRDVTLSELSEYIDVDSFIDYYLIQELMVQSEVSYKSVFMSKSRDGKLKMGPLWDYDWALDGPSLLKWRIIYDAPIDEFATQGSWFYALLNGSAEFRGAVTSRWEEISLALRSAVLEFEAEQAYVYAGAKKDYLRWHPITPFNSYEKSLAKTLDTLSNRITWLDSALSAY